MIVSDQHRYAFLQFPQAASTAIGDELVEHYGGRSILRKHAMHHHFRAWAGESASDYFVFSSIRNPLDKVVSLYYKLKSDHKGNHSDPSNWKSNGGWIRRRQLRRFRYAQRDATDFSDYFRRFYWLPYADWSTLDHAELDFMIRVENIQDDFAEALDLLGIDQIRELPVVNPTSSKRDDSWSEYPPDLRERAVRVMAPIMERLGYEFPEGWPARSPTPADRALFEMVRRLKGVYYRRLW